MSNRNLMTFEQLKTRLWRPAEPGKYPEMKKGYNSAAAKPRHRKDRSPKRSRAKVMNEWRAAVRLATTRAKLEQGDKYKGIKHSDVRELVDPRLLAKGQS